MALTAEEKAAAKAAKDAEKAAAKVAKADTSSVTVSWLGNMREYSKEIHGDNFMALAEEFAAHIGGTVA